MKASNDTQKAGDKTLRSASASEGCAKGPETQSASDASCTFETTEKLQPHLFVLFERSRPLAGGSRHSLANIERVAIGRGEARRARRVIEGKRPTLVVQIPDARMSASHARIDCDRGEWRLTDCGSTNGARVNGSKVAEATLADGDVVELGQTLFLFRGAVATPVNAPGDVDSSELEGVLATFGTLCPILSRDLDNLARLARSDVSVLIEGETGTGKEVLARAIHVASGRSGRFVAVNCAALPQGLVESLLFGHKKGAFSGATSDEVGFVKAAHGGTLLLDEVGDLPAAAQPVLLRVLQEREVAPLGSTRPESVDVRFIAASHRSLRTLAGSGGFRKDLLARLTQVSCSIPPLRDRLEDIGLLVAAILPRVAGARARSLSLSRAAACHLVSHGWPMNVRELEHVLKVGVLLTRGDRVDLAVRQEKSTDGPPGPRTRGVVRSSLSPEDAVLHADLRAKVAEHRGNVTRVAEAMGTTRRQVQRWMTRFQIDAMRFRR